MLRQCVPWPQIAASNCDGAFLHHIDSSHRPHQFFGVSSSLSASDSASLIPVVSAVKVSGFPYLTTEFGVTKHTPKLTEQQMRNRKAGDLCTDLLLLFPGGLALHIEKYSCQRRELEGCDQISVRCVFCCKK